MSGDSSQLSDQDSPAVPLPATIDELDITTSLHDLQTEEQRRILDAVAQVRKCGLESILSLPQLVVCGDQSAGKSSVLEALTEIPFPRNDNLCTRFATEIILRRGPMNTLTIKVIPHFDSENDVKAWFIYDFNVMGPLSKEEVLSIPHEVFHATRKEDTWIFTPREQWIDKGRKYCSMYTWGGSYMTE